jgi:hypothetical protein
MYKYIVKAGLVGLIIILFTGCLKEEEVNCNDSAVQGLIQEIISESLIDKIVFKKAIREKKKEPDYKSNPFMTEEFMEGMFILMIMQEKNKEGSVINKLYKQTLSEIKAQTFSLTDVMTTKKEKELSRVECKANLNIGLQSGNYTFDIVYNAQLTDDKESIFVEVTEF